MATRPEPPAVRYNPSHMRAIVFVLRGCPAGWLGTYGNEWVATPHLDRLAAEGVVFDRHISDRPDAEGACAAWLGGVMPSGSRLPDVLRAANIRTVLVRANHPDTDAPGWFYADWDEVFDARPQEQDRSPLDQFIRSVPTLLEHLAAVPNFLLWVETNRLLPPWDIPQDVFEAYLSEAETSEDADHKQQEEEEDEEEHDEEPESREEVKSQDDPEQPEFSVTPWSDPPIGPMDTTDPDALEWLHTSFAALVTTLDAELGSVFDLLRARGLDQSATWLVTSDFGFPLGEHGLIGPYRPWLHEELVHLPLIMRLPAGAEAGRRVAGFTQPPDLAPTLLDLFGVKPPDGMTGYSLLPLARGEAESVRPHAITELELGDAAESAIRTNEWAYLLPLRIPEGETREPQLYEKPDDRWEVNDLRPRNIERADELEDLLKKQSPTRKTQSTS